MEYNIKHITRYEFDSPVFLEPHLLRFYPRANAHCYTKSVGLHITPQPAGQNNVLEATGSNATLCWFENMHRSLEVVAEMNVKMFPCNPFSFLVHPAENVNLPLKYSSIEKQLLCSALTIDPPEISDEIFRRVKEIREYSNNNTVVFLTNLNNAIAAEFDVRYRDDGPPLSPCETFERREGSCRDLAWLHVSMLRHAGIASRFVSGYFYLDAEEPVWELHAWVEAYIPGGGWRGFDPSHGLACADQHVAIAASPFPESTMPVAGSYRGTAKARLTHQISILKR